MVRLVLAACWVVPLIGIKWSYRFWLVIVLLVYVQLYTVSYATIWHYYYVSYYSMPLACYQALGASTFCLILTVLLWTWMSIFLLSVLLIIHSQWNYWIICWFGFFLYKSLDHLYSKRIFFTLVSKSSYLSTSSAVLLFKIYIKCCLLSLIGISLVIDDKHLVMCFRPICRYSWGCLLKSGLLSTFPFCSVAGNEGLLACKLLPSTPCVLHCRAHGDAVALWFRSSCSVLSDYLSCHCQKLMETS